MIADFVALDFETACPTKPRRVCSVGVTVVRDGRVAPAVNYYVDPQVPIDPFCQEVHGITDEMVSGCPDFATVWQQLRELLRSAPVLVVHNAPFDYYVLAEELELMGEAVPDWIEVYDTLRLARARVDLPSYSLPDACKHYGVDVLSHHCSGDDSEMCARLFLRMQEELGDFAGEEYRPGRGDQPKKHHRSSDTPLYIAPDVDYDNPSELTFEGCTFVLTGTIGTIARSQLKSMIEERGGTVTDRISGKTSYLVVGYEGINVVSDKSGGKSRKILDAEHRRANGGTIQIVSGDLLLEQLLG